MNMRLWAVLGLILLCLNSVSANENFVCTVCREQVARGFTVNNKFYCPDHVESALPRCYNCAQPISGHYHEVSERKVPVCSTCREQVPQCFLCSLPADPQRGGEALRDGRYICADDRKLAVKTPQHAKRIFQQAEGEVRETFGSALRLKDPIARVELVDLNGFERAATGSGHVNGLKAGKVLGVTTVVFVSRGEERWLEPAVIHLLDHVPSQRMLSVSAHEYAHVWQAQHHRDYAHTKPVMREGFAEWVAYKVAQRQGRRDQMTVMMNSNGGVYYQGLRKFLELERQRGVEGVLTYAKKATKI